MGNTAAPDVMRALAALTITNTTVSLGPRPVGDPGRYLLVGVDSPTPQGDRLAARVTRSWATTGLQAAQDQDGEVTCLAYAWSGDQDAADAVLSEVDLILTAVEDAIAADESLGVATVLWSYVDSEDWQQAQGSKGVAVWVVFTVKFRARI